MRRDTKCPSMNDVGLFQQSKEYKRQLNDASPDDALDYLECARHQQENAGSDWDYQGDETHLDIHIQISVESLWVIFSSTRNR